MKLMMSLLMRVALNSLNIRVSALIQINLDSRFIVTLQYKTFGNKSIEPPE